MALATEAQWDAQAELHGVQFIEQWCAGFAAGTMLPYNMLRSKSTANRGAVDTYEWSYDGGATWTDLNPAIHKYVGPNIQAFGVADPPP